MSIANRSTNILLHPVLRKYIEDHPILSPSQRRVIELEDTLEEWYDLMPALINAYPRGSVERASFQKALDKTEALLYPEGQENKDGDSTSTE